jgi:hypothetical protein
VAELKVELAEVRLQLDEANEQHEIARRQADQAVQVPVFLNLFILYSVMMFLV